MKRLFFSLTTAMFAYAATAASFSVTGNAVLQEANIHNDITVSFEKQSVIGTNTSVLTSANGNYALSVGEGVYHVIFSRAGFVNDTIKDVFVDQELNLQDVFLNLHITVGLSGQLTGILEEGKYYVVGDLTVAQEGAIIEPGVELVFIGNFYFRVDPRATFNLRGINP